MYYYKKSVLLLCFILLPFIASTHPLDISLTSIQFNDSYILGTTYIHPYEISLLADDYNMAIKDLNEEHLRNILLPYFDKHFKMYGKNGLLKKTDIQLQNTQIHEIISSGVYINYLIYIEDNIFPITFYADLFVEYFVTQTNKIALLKKDGSQFPGSVEIYLTAKKTEWSFDPVNPDFSAFNDDLTDSDEDGLTDNFEKLYGMNIYNPDTDGDGFTDAEEFNFGWNPFDPKLDPGQSQEVLSDAYITFDTAEESVTDNSIASAPPESILQDDDSPGEVHTQADLSAVENVIKSRNLIKEYSIKDKNIPDSDFLTKTTAQIKEFFSGNFNLGGLLLLLISVFVLGFLHAMLPEHGQGILIAYLTEKNKRLIHALGFILTFTTTHLIDVIILALGFTIFFSAMDTTQATYILKIIGGSGLVLIAIYMIWKGIKELKKKKNTYNDKNTKAKNKTKGALLMGILTGLAPCPFGWALLMVLISIGKVEMVPLIILVFGLGIFTFLFLLSIGIFMLRYIAFDLFSRISKYSKLISGILILIFAIMFFSPRIIL